MQHPNHLWTQRECKFSMGTRNFWFFHWCFLQEKNFRSWSTIWIYMKSIAINIENHCLFRVFNPFFNYIQKCSMLWKIYVYVCSNNSGNRAWDVPSHKQKQQSQTWNVKNGAISSLHMIGECVSLRLVYVFIVYQDVKLCVQKILCIVKYSL